MTRLAPLPLTRRDFLRRSGMGFASLGLADLMASQGLVSAAPDAGRPSRRWPPRHRTSPPKAKRVIHLFMNGGPSHVDTFDPKPLLAKVRRQAAAAHQPPHRTQDRRGLPVAVQVPAATARAASRSANSFPHVAAVHRRHLRHPLDARRRAQSRAVAAADELRRGPADPAEHGLVGDLRPGQREPEPARLHRHVPRRLSDPGNAELAGRLPARRLPGHLHRHAAHRHRKADRAHQEQHTVDRASSAASSICCVSSTNAIRAPAARRPARSAHPVVRAGLSHADGRHRRLRRQPRAEAHPRDVRPRHAGPADPDRPAAARTRRALRAGLARRGPAVGQPRRPRDPTPPPGPRVRPGHRRPARWT